MFGPPVHIDDSGAEGAEVDADLAEELAESTEDAASVRRSQYVGAMGEVRSHDHTSAGADTEKPSPTHFQFDPQAIAFEYEKAEKAEEAEKSAS